MSKGRMMSVEVRERDVAWPPGIFHTLEALGEHVGSTWSALDKIGRDTQHKARFSNNLDDGPRFPVGTPEYHLWAIDRYASAIFQTLAELHPDWYRQSEGD